MGTRSGWWGTMAVGLLATASCAGEPLDLVGDDSTPVALESLAANFEQVSWQEGLLDADEWRNKLPDEAIGPCECTGHACLENWVDGEFGCDVCVAVRCPNQEPEHVCVSC